MKEKGTTTMFADLKSVLLKPFFHPLVYRRKVLLRLSDGSVSPCQKLSVDHSSLIQEGKFGKVYRAEYTMDVIHNGRIGNVALEVVVKEVNASLGDTLHEIESLSRLRDVSGIVQLLDYIQDGRRGILVLEKAQGDLMDFIDQKKDPLPVIQLIRLAKGITRALMACHERGIVHCDLKLENIGILRNGSPILLDFGKSREIGDHAYSAGELRGSLHYLAPELCLLSTSVIEDADLTCIDRWNLGVTLYCLAFRRFPFCSKTIREQYRLTQCEPDYTGQGVPSWFIEILRGLLRKIPRDRWTLEQVLEKLMQGEPRERPLTIEPCNDSLK